MYMPPACKAEKVEVGAGPGLKGARGRARGKGRKGGWMEGLMEGRKEGRLRRGGGVEGVGCGVRGVGCAGVGRSG